MVDLPRLGRRRANTTLRRFRENIGRRKRNVDIRHVPVDGPVFDRGYRGGRNENGPSTDDTIASADEHWRPVPGVLPNAARVKQIVYERSTTAVENRRGCKTAFARPVPYSYTRLIFVLIPGRRRWRLRLPRIAFSGRGREGSKLRARPERVTPTRTRATEVARIAWRIYITTASGGREKKNVRRRLHGLIRPNNNTNERDRPIYLNKCSSATFHEGRSVRHLTAAVRHEASRLAEYYKTRPHVFSPQSNRATRSFRPNDAYDYIIPAMGEQTPG